MMIAFSTEPEGVQQDPVVSCARALVETFVAELRARVPAERVTFGVDYASLAHTPHPATVTALHMRIVALASVLAAHIHERSTASVHLAFSGVRTSGSIHLEVTLEHAELVPEGLAAEIAAQGGALLHCERRRAVIAFYPMMLESSESISSHR